MRIVLDAAGGDHAPEQPVRGAVLAARELGCQIVLVGPEAAIRAELAKHRTAGLDLEVLDAPEVIEMDEHPALAVRRKTRSSHVVGLRMVRDGQADAFVSAGHSGATMAAATLVLGRIRGIERPALAILFPSRERMFLLLYFGATSAGWASSARAWRCWQMARRPARAIGWCRRRTSYCVRAR